MMRWRVDVKVSMRPTAAVGSSSPAAVGSSSPRPTPARTSVRGVTLPLGASAPLAAVGAGLPILADAESRALPGGDVVLFPPGLGEEAFRRITPGASDMSREEFQQRVQPGFGPAFKDATTAAGRVLQGAIDQADQVIGSINARAAAAGLPTIPEISPTLQALIDGESQSEEGNIGFEAMLARLEVSPQWRADP